MALAAQIKWEKPSIKIHYTKDSNAEWMEEICLGIEEEGLPYEMILTDTNDVLQIAYEACEASKLGVGIGLGKSEVVMQVDKLKKEKPLFLRTIQTAGQLVTQEGEEVSIRQIGSNAARFVKGIPLKPL